MGKSFAPHYACLTMGYLEETILIPTLMPQYFDTNTQEVIIRAFMRYIDDGIIELPKSIPMETFLGVLNRMHPSIQYNASQEVRRPTDSIVYSCTNFLSIKVLVDSSGNIEFDVSYTTIWLSTAITPSTRKTTFHTSLQKE